MTTVRQLLDKKGEKIWSIHPDAAVFDAIAKMADVRWDAWTGLILEPIQTWNSAAVVGKRRQ